MKPQRAMSEEFAPSPNQPPAPPAAPQLVTSSTLYCCSTFALHFMLPRTHTHTHSHTLATRMLKRGSNYCLFIYSYSHVYPF